ncbi:MAG: GGDEF domain-containing protein [Chlorobiaceae bacterium]|nr:GGDEF domain-containing protein [Chlorobiaceae bacterium]
MKYENDTNSKGFIRLAIVSGVAALLLAIAGTAWFGAFQSSRLREIAQTQAFCIKLVECRSAISLIERQIAEEQLPATKVARLQSSLRIECARFIDIGRSSGIAPESMLGRWLKNRKPITGSISHESLQFMIVDLDQMIEATTIQIAREHDLIAASLNYYLVFITLLLIVVMLTGGRLIISTYRHSIIPLNQLAYRLTLMNRNLPESLHDTATAAENLLCDSEPSAEIRSVSESVADLCHVIEEKNKKLDEIYIRDEKTNLYNYRHFKEHLIIDVERAKRFGSDIALAMIDIDYFKHYNDRNGHIAGDRVLVRIAEMIRQECRATDIPSRFGGDEFALLFPNTDRYTALEIAERLRSIINDEPFEHKHNQPDGQLTVSIGIASWPDDAGDWHALINNADHALYEAKSAGRNIVMAYSSPLAICESE